MSRSLDRPEEKPKGQTFLLRQPAKSPVPRSQCQAQTGPQLKAEARGPGWQRGSEAAWAAAAGEALTFLPGGDAASCCCLAMFSDRHQHTLFFCSCECASKVNKHSAF